MTAQFEQDAERLAGPDSTPPADVDSRAPARREARFSASLVAAAASTLRGGDPALEAIAERLTTAYRDDDDLGAIDPLTLDGRAKVTRKLERIRHELEKAMRDPINGQGWRALRALDLAILSLSI